ncbi:hypothetical protein EJ04DRAFT_511712 [Polyplosphaeria fusca]|uniref:mRNA export factor GLE1 n=1 Tax=Polyplosphaeria fusca TaxID=682080 RepID=A0A9P4R2C9_9PLEO|nr:hypothetical protein EJ04DRAFT_511712 [Polyplosphaeria fusca]
MTLLSDSPTRQMAIDLSLMLLKSDRDFNQRLDQNAANNARIHHEQLNKAALIHAQVREEAELEQAQARMRRELEAKQREVEIARRAAEEQRKLQEAEANLRAIEEEQKRRHEQAEKERQAKVAAEEQRKLREAEKERQAKIAADAAAAERARAQAAQQQPTPAPKAPVPAPQVPAQQLSQATTTLSATSKDAEELHMKYLELHQRIKNFRKKLINDNKSKGNPLKPYIGGTRRDLRIPFGQVTVERKDSKEAINKMRAILNRVRDLGGPTIDIRPYIISQPIPPLSNESEAQYPALLLFGLNCFIKTLFKQFDSEAVKEDGKIIQELGLIAASLLADPKYTWKDIALIDLLMAKYHKACPVLFGITANGKTLDGMKRLGWIDKKADGDADGVQDTLNSFRQRMTGLGSGFAALSLRQFSNRPAIPMSMYWNAVTSICSHPAHVLANAHYFVLKGLLRDYASKFISMYGVQARAVIRRATLELPKDANADAQDAAKLVEVLPVNWKKNHRLSV